MNAMHYGGALQFDVALLDRSPGDRMWKEEYDEDLARDSAAIHQDSIANPGATYDENQDFDHAGFTIELTDADGHTSHVAITDHYLLICPRQMPYFKLRVFESRKETEPIPQHIEIDLSFFSGNAAFNSGKLAEIRFIFDSSPEGVISLDNVGFTNF